MNARSLIGRLIVKSRFALGAAALILSASAFAAATIVITNTNAAGVGFNDPTPVAPVGGNTGTTLGQQRLNAFQSAANLWGATLTSTVTINIDAAFVALTCTATSAVLGSAGPTEVQRDFTGAPLAGTWYVFALANKLSGADQDPGVPQIRARFNVNLGNPGCLTGAPFYLGLDNNHGPLIDLVTVLLHEFGHGLGFLTLVNGQTGAFLAGFPDVWNGFMFDNTAGKTWLAMTAAERATSALNTRNLVWAGANVTNDAPSILSLGTPQLRVTAPPSVAGFYVVGTAAFGPPLGSPGVTADIMPVVDQGTGPACTPLNANNARAVFHNIALIDRGVCSFTVKVKNAQDAGAVGVIIANNVAGSPPPGLGGSDPSITIPAASISLADGNTLKGALIFRSRTRSGVIGNLGVNLAQLAGADPSGRVLLYTPNPFQPGSSVSHWDTIAFPNLLMEPAINGDLLHAVAPPADLTFNLLRDIGW